MPHICIVASTFYKDITNELLLGAKAQLDKVQATYDLIEVPGAFEVPAAIACAIESNRYQGYIALGCVIRGETSHYDYVCGESARGLNELAMAHKAAIGYGILTVETPEQAWMRAAVTQGNKGAVAVDACLAMIAVQQKMGMA
jgi:6,7-dimethyl-8-ribityllumazine synthase